ncbi:MAG TPA: hypothetical protein VF713_07115 [Thermoanaerobaculia bacterium]
MNRAERRQTIQELHLIRRGLENAPTIYTEDEVEAARAEAIESISNHHYNMLRKSITIARLDWDDTIEALDIEVGELRATLNEIGNSEAFLFRENHRAFNRSMDLSRSVTALSSRVDAILAVFSLVTDERRDQAHRTSMVIRPSAHAHGRNASETSTWSASDSDHGR